VIWLSLANKLISDIGGNITGDIRGNIKVKDALNKRSGILKISNIQIEQTPQLPVQLAFLANSRVRVD
jgi:hypothetical protein